jgi:hypothetical protein
VRVARTYYGHKPIIIHDATKMPFTHCDTLTRDKIAAMVLAIAAERNAESRCFSARTIPAAAVNDSVSEAMR